MAGPLIDIKKQIASNLGADIAPTAPPLVNSNVGKTNGGKKFGATAAIVGSVIASLVGSAVSYFSSKHNTDSANRANRDIADKQNQANLDMWNIANEYNTPSAQMLRLRQAGINPNLYYANGQGSNISVNPPQMTGGAPYNVADSAHIDLAGASQLALIDAQTRNINANTNKTISETQGTEIDNVVKQLTQGNVVEMSNLQVESLKNNLAIQGLTKQQMAEVLVKTNAEVDKINSQIYNLNVDSALKRLQADRYDDIIDSQLKNQDANTKKALSDIGVNKAKVKELLSMVLLNNSNSAKVNQDIQIGSIRLKYEDQKLYLENALLDKQNTAQTYANRSAHLTSSTDVGIENSGPFYGLYALLRIIGSVLSIKL